MSKRFEDFVQNNRDAFDGDEPSDLVWNKINQRLNPTVKKTKVVQMVWLKWAAAAVVLAIVGLVVFNLNNKKTTNPGDIADAPKKSTEVRSSDSALLNEINPAYAKELYHFTQLIELKQEELKQIEKDNPDLYKQFLGDINQLDSSYNVLKKELPANPNREQLLEAMISNLQLQMDLLNQQLQVIHQIKQTSGIKKSA